MNELRRCPFCGCNAELIDDFKNRTWIAACKGTGCHASISVHYGWRTNLALCTRRVGGPPKSRKSIARTECQNTWNRRNDKFREFVTRAYRAMKEIAKEYNPDVVIEADLSELGDDSF